MFDINFFMRIHDLKQRVINGESFDKEVVFEEFEKCRSRTPFIYNIETTNACNMKCEMCPRTTMMTREIEVLEQGIFESVVEQITPFSTEQWKTWESFVEEKYGLEL